MLSRPWFGSVAWRNLRSRFRCGVGRHDTTRTLVSNSVTLHDPNHGLDTCTRDPSDHDQSSTTMTSNSVTLRDPGSPPRRARLLIGAVSAWVQCRPIIHYCLFNDLLLWALIKNDINKHYYCQVVNFEFLTSKWAHRTRSVHDLSLLAYSSSWHRGHHTACGVTVDELHRGWYSYRAC